MKKVSVLMAALLFATAMAMAGQIAWVVPYGVYGHEATVLDADTGYVLENYDVLWQLIYAGDNKVADPVDILADGYVSGDDQVIGTRLFNKGDATDTVSGKVYDDLGLFTDRDAIATIVPPPIKLDGGAERELVAGDYVYQRIFESQTPQAGTYYLQTDAIPLDSDYTSSCQRFAWNDNYDSGVKADLVVQGGNVPEPATMSLLGLGALAMVLRRKLRK